MSNQHALTRQPEAVAFVTQATGIDERLQLGAEPSPDVDTVAYLYGIQVDSVDQPQAGEEGVAQSLVG